MTRRSRNVSLLAATIFLLDWSGVQAFDATYNLPCIVDYNGKPPITTSCLTDINNSRGTIVETIKTHNGKSFIIENNKSDDHEWYIDRKPAERISEEPYTCYQSREVKLCL